MQREVLYGVHPVGSALSAERRKISGLFALPSGQQNPRQKHIVGQARRRGLPVETMDRDEIERKAGTAEHQGIAARVGAYPLMGLADLLAAIPGEAYPFLLVADGIVDPHNLGALARTAACVGVHGIVIPKDRAAQPTPAVSKASAGAIETMAVARETNLVRAIDFLKENGIWVAGLESNEGIALFESDLAGSLALVVGSEEKGIRRLVKEHCDFLVAIPQTASVSSLNASVAGAVAMYEVYRQRHYCPK